MIIYFASSTHKVRNKLLKDTGGNAVLLSYWILKEEKEKDFLRELREEIFNEISENETS